MVDEAGSCVVVCSIENLDPMGVHTGDSWTVAPQQTLPDEEYQRLREAAFACARTVGVATGGANVQFAYEPASRELALIEMNPRVSRSSALASKATGFPIAKLAALLAVGYTLEELPNDITGETTAAFEPALDYVAVKAPRFDFEKFPGADTSLGTEMRATGEALGLGRTFPGGVPQGGRRARGRLGAARHRRPSPLLRARAGRDPRRSRAGARRRRRRGGEALRAPGRDHRRRAGRLRRPRCARAAAFPAGSRSTPARPSSRRGRRTTTSRTRTPTRSRRPRAAPWWSSARDRTASARGSSSTTAASAPRARCARSGTRP